MEIKIDTAKDSKEDIKKAINFLNTLIDQEVESQLFKEQSNNTVNTASNISQDIFATPISEKTTAKKKKSPEEELFGDDSIQIVPY